MIPSTSPQSWQLERHLLPALVRVDGLVDSVSKMNPESLRLPEVSSMIGMLLIVRNEIATLCDVNRRELESHPKGYELDEPVAARWDVPNLSWDSFKLNGGYFEAKAPDRLATDAQVIVVIDDTVTQLERLIWEQAYPVHRDDAVTNTVVRNPRYADPLALNRNSLLGVRNGAAMRQGVPVREAHDLRVHATPEWKLEADLPNLGFQPTVPVRSLRKAG